MPALDTFDWLEGWWIGLNAFLFGLTAGWAFFHNGLAREPAAATGNTSRAAGGSTCSKSLQHSADGQLREQQQLLKRLVCIRTLGFAIQSFHLIAVYRLWETSR
ncbi:hypothetical protein Agub_g16074, partial [Astrephomene gubernaculifera]